MATNHDTLVGAEKKLGSQGRDLSHRESRGLFSKLDSSRFFRPIVYLLPAVVAGLTVAPNLVSRQYPVDENLVGTPAAGNIKAPFDVDVPDEETTEQLRQEALSKLPRVYDFDVAMGDKIAGVVEGALARMRLKIDAFMVAHPELADAREAKVEAALQEVVLPAWAEFEKAIGTSISPEEMNYLVDRRFDAALAQMVGKAVRDAMSMPLVTGRQALEADRSLGLSIQRVPTKSGDVKFVRDVDSIAELEVLRRDFGQRVKRLFVDAAPAERDFVVTFGARLLDANLTFNRAATELAREVARLGVKPVTLAVKKGEMVIRDGERLTRRHFLVFRTLSESNSQVSGFLVTFGAAFAVLVLILAALRAGRGRRIKLTARDLTFLAVLFSLSLGAVRLWLVLATALHDQFNAWPRDAFLYMMPVAAGAMMVRLVLKTEVALGFALLLSLVMGLMVDTDRLYPLFAVVGASLAATALGSISARGDVLRAGAWVGIGQTCVALALQLFSGVMEPSAYFINLPVAFLGGFLAGLVTLAVIPLVEMGFGYSTDLKLLELANLNHPALKELIVQAPGSYHHSVIVGSLVEAAAEAVDCNPLLARVMSYYHDLGKGCNPGYFIENQRAGHNPHDKLKPSMSAMIIRRHVTDGLDLAKKYRLGEPIFAAIAEHHGTTLIHYFYHRAKEQEDKEHPVHEADYRYPGQKPQTREAALVMLGDSVEAASRSLADPTPARLAGLVSRIINIKFTDGQLDECDLTLRDLHTIARSFSRVLNSIYHQRPEYPELLKDITGKKGHADSDPKQPAKKAQSKDGAAATTAEDPAVDPKPDHLKRLGLS